MNSPIRVLVVGGGPGGLAASIALRQFDIAVDLIDNKTDFRPEGSELMISGSMLRTLDSLGLADACAEVGAHIDRSSFLDQDGNTMAVVPLPQVARVGLPPSLGIGRVALHDILARRAAGLGASIEVGVGPEKIRSHEDGVTVQLTNGEEREYDLVVGADGIRSTVRRLVFTDAASPVVTPQAVWRARVERTTAMDHLLVQYGHHECKSIIIPVSDEHAYVAALTLAEEGRVSADDGAALFAKHLEPFGGPAADAREQLLSSGTKVHYSPAIAFLQPRPWHRGRVLLIGDAAHATTPHMAYGAGIATEDGLVLGEVLNERGDDMESALEAFVERRWERCRMVVDNSIQLGKWEVDPASADGDALGMSAALTEQTWGALAAPI